MASVTKQGRKPAATYDAAVEAHLARARQRIRSLDITVALLGFVCGTLAYALVVALADAWLKLPPLLRQAALLVYLVAAVVYLLLALVRPLCRRINPYYAARHIEQAVPEAKNSVVNWLDLHDQPLPPAIRGAVGQRAARDVARVDLEQAISGRRAAWLGGLTGLLALSFFVALLLLGGRPFFSLLGRAFVPFTEAPIATRTQLTVKQPDGGNCSVDVGRSVHFLVEAHGWVPEAGQPHALRLLFRYQQTDPYEERPLEREGDHDWTLTLPAFQVQNGFWYRIEGGDAQTPEYRVTAHSPPLVQQFDVTYHFRPYLGWPDLKSHDPHLRQLRGTAVTLVAHTNRLVRVQDSHLDLELHSLPAGGDGGKNQENLPPPGEAHAVTVSEGKGPVTALRAEAVPDDPRALQFHWVLRESGKYRLWFASAEGENNSDPTPYTIEVLQDHPPTVELTKPGQDVTLPVNGVLQLEGAATDDLGLKNVTLHLQLAGRELQPRPYRQGKDLRLADGGYPRTLHYKDFVDLATVKDAAGHPLTLQKDMVLEYWLEAADACDFPEPNVATSRHYKVTLDKSEADPKKPQQEREQAQEEQKQHDAGEDQQLQAEHNQPPENSSAEQSQQENGEQKQQQGNGQNSESKKGQQEKGQQGNNGAGQQGKQQQGGEQQGQDAMQKEAQNLGQAIQQHEQQHGESKPQPPKEPKGENKNGGQQQSEPKPGQSKQGQGSQGSCNCKGGGNNSGGQQPGPGQAKDEGQGGQQGPGKGKEQPGTGTGTGTGKEGGEAHQPDKGELHHEQGGTKGNGAPETFRGSGQGGGPEPKGDLKDEPMALNRGETRDHSPQDSPEKQAGGAGKDGGQEPAEKTGPRGQDKPAPQDKTGSSVDRAQARGDQPKADAEEEDGQARQMKPEEVDQLAKKLKNGSPKERSSAARRLSEASRKAEDAAVREAAGKALKDPGREQGGKPGGHESAGQGKGRAGEDRTRPGEVNDGQATGTNPSQGPPGGKTKESNDQGGDKPGTGNGGGRPHQDGSPAEDQEPEPDQNPVNAQHQQQAGELQLEDVKKLIDEVKQHPQDLDQVLNKLGMTRKRFREVEEYVKETLPASQQRGALSDLAAREAQTPQGTKASTRSTTQALPPPGFRDSSREFTRKLAEQHN